VPIKLARRSIPSLSAPTITGVRREHIDAFIADYNESAEPFVRTKAEVHQKRLKARIARQ
jgi:hypothetical protein